MPSLPLPLNSHCRVLPQLKEIFVFCPANEHPSQFLYFQSSLPLFHGLPFSFQLNEKLLFCEFVDLLQWSLDAVVLVVVICNLSPCLNALKLLYLFLYLDLLHAISLYKPLLLSRCCHQRIVLVHHLVKRLAKHVRFCVRLTEIVSCIQMNRPRRLRCNRLVQSLWNVVWSILNSRMPHWQRLFLINFFL